MHPIFAGVNPERLTLIDILRWRAQHEPQQEAYAFLLDGETKKAQMTYADLDLQARRIATLLLDCVATGERVLLLYPPGLEYITAIFGCFYAGVVAVPAYPPRPNQHHQRIQIIVQDAQVTAVLTTSKICLSLQRAGTLLQDLEWIVTDTSNQQAGMPPSPPSPQALALLQYTSGSTSSPKGVMLTHANLVQNAALIQAGAELTSETRSLFWVPPYHDMGLMGGILQALYTGYPTVLMAPTAFLQQPLRWLQVISSFRATGSGGPNFAYDLCVRSATPEAIKRLDLSSWTLAFTSAEPVRAETLARFAETFAPCGFRPEAFYPCYGLAEATLFVSGGQRLDRPCIRTFDIHALENGHAVEVTGQQESSRSLVSCGHVRQGQEVAIVDPQAQTRCAEGTVGEIWVRGPNVALGYWGKEEETEEVFHAFLRESSGQPMSGGGPSLRTGDLGFCLAGELYVTGRLKDLIIIRGRNLYPQDIEQVVEKSHPLLRQSCCAVFAVEGARAEQVVAVQEVSRHADEMGMQEAMEAICQAVLSEFDVEVAAVELLRIGTISKTTSGKIQRHACRNRFLAGELDAVYRWKRENRVGTGLAPVRCEPIDTVCAGDDGQGQAAVPTRFTPSVQDIVNWLVLHIAKRAHMDAHAVDLHAPFVQFGLNSLEAIGLSGELERWLGLSLSPTLIYDYPSIDALARYLAGRSVDGLTGSVKDPRPLRDHPKYLPMKVAPARPDAIAIIGLGCRFPGADNPEAFWQMLHDGIDGISEVPTTRWNATQFYAPDQAIPGKMSTRWGGFLENIELFDPSFFHISPREAEVMDPQQRLLLEVAWETFEHAGLVPEKLAGRECGVFIGVSSNDYYTLHYKAPNYHQAYTGTGNAQSIAANRLSYFFDFHGPSVAVDTACSSSLFAIHQACQSLRLGECDLALAGGVNVILTPELTITFSQAHMMSSDGRCKTFDASADGYVRSEGCGLVLLKPLADAQRDGDRVLAIIRGSAVNQDGRSNGLTAPHGPSQEAVIRRALQQAGVSPHEISYVETHGSSTPLGDPIEVEALKAVLMQERSPDQPCLLGSVKTNIGHLEAAAGIASLIKTVLCLQKGVIAPNLHFKTLNPHISFAGTTFAVPTEPRQWPGQPHTQRFAGVSAFGFGGTNAHVILEGTPECTTIALPTSPFKREYCWFQSQETSEGDTDRARMPWVNTADAKTRSKALTTYPTESGSHPSSHNEIDTLLYQLRWQALDLPTQTSSTQAGHWLIFMDLQGIGQHLAQQLQAQGHTCILISHGENFQILNPHHFQVNPANPQEIKQAIATALMAVGTLPLHGVIHLWSLDTTPASATTPTTLEADQILGIQSALSLIQSLVENTVQTRLWLITQGAQPVGTGASPVPTVPVHVHDPANSYVDLAISQSPLWGLGKTCALEHPELWGGLIDLDPHATLDDTTNELTAVLQGDSGEDQIALRGTTTYVSRITRNPLEEPRMLHLTPNGAYLITGGLSGLGLSVALWLAMKGVRHLVLLSRSELPSRETWDEVQIASRQGMQIATLRLIERLGAQVHTASVDITDEAQVVAILSSWDKLDQRSESAGRDRQQEQPPIRGIIHTASVWQDTQGRSMVKPLAQLSTVDLLTVLRPKMLGGWLLAKWFQETPLDFFVSFSSAASLLGSAAQGNYAAANSFLDVLAYYQRAHGQPAISIAWGPISEVGFGATPEGLRFQQYWQSRGLEPLSPANVLSALELLLQENLAHVGVFRLDWQQLEQFSPQMMALPLVRQLVRGNHTANVPTHNEVEHGDNETNIRQTLQQAREEVHPAILTSYVKAQIAYVLGVSPSQLDAEQPLTTLGFDSLMAIELKNRLDRDLQTHIPLATLLQGISIAQFVNHMLTLEGPWGRHRDTKIEVGEVETEASLVSPPPSPSPVALTTYLPLSHNQKALWFLSQLAPESAAYNLVSSIRIRQHLDVSALQRTLQVLANRYPLLTSTYILHNGEPAQQTRGNQPFPLEEIDATARSLDDLKHMLEEDGHRPIDLTNGPVLRVKLYHRTDDDHILGFIVQHIAVDFWSLELLLDELARLYAIEITTTPQASGHVHGIRLAQSERPSACQHADYVRWQNSMLQSEAGEQHWQYWQNELAGDLAVLNLPTDRPRPAVQTYKGASHSFSLSTELATKLRTVARVEKVTLFTLMLTAYQVLLHRYTSQDDILIGTPALGRTRSELERVVGDLVNPVIVRARVGARGHHPTFKELLHQTKRSLLAALEHQDFPFSLLVERLQPHRDPSFSPIFQTLFIWDRPHALNGDASLRQRMEAQCQAELEQETLSLEPFTYGQQGAAFDLTLTVFEIEGRLAVDFRYNVDLFDAGTISRMAECFLTLLDSLVNSPDQYVRELPLLSDNVRQKLLIEWNDTHRDYPRDVCLHQLFEEQAEQTPDTIALVFADEQLTYAELNRRANQLAHYLHHLGVGPDVLVGVSLARSIEMVVGLLAVLKAGCAYVPLDPSYPEARLARMLADAQVAIVLTHHQFDGSLGLICEGIVCILDTDWRIIAREKQENLQIPVESAHLVYLLYTSGSTGQPKGVQIPHRAVVNFLTSMREQLAFTREETLLSVTPITFDIAGLELFLPFMVGSRVVMVSQEVARDGERLGLAIRQHGTTIMQATPSTWRLLLNADGLAGSSLRILCGGESMPPDLAHQLLDVGVSVWNLYGPTETTIWSTAYPVTAVNGPLPIGRPLANTQIYLLDKDLQPVPIGVVGELYIGGEGLARGYVSRPEQTAERFIPNPFPTPVGIGGAERGEGGIRAMLDRSIDRSCPPVPVRGERLYRTGDLARYRTDGAIEYLGRIDHQVKLRGYRIELGEIEASLQAHPAVQDAVVVLREESEVRKYLAAYLVARVDPVPTDTPIFAHLLESVGPCVAPMSTLVQEYLRERLPDYMVPTSLVFLETLPLTPNGKVDRKALPSPEISTYHGPTFVAPRNPAEHTLVTIWQQVLHRERVCIHDNFFELGGDSILSLQIIAHARLAGWHITPKHILQHQTIAQLATVAVPNGQVGGEGAEWRGGGLGPTLAGASLDRLRAGREQLVEDLYPLTPAQQGMLFHTLYAPDSGVYIEQVSCTLRGKLEIRAFERAWQQVIRQQVALRTALAWQEVDEPLQIVYKHVVLPLSILDWRSREPSLQEADLKAFLQSDRAQGFDLKQAPLMRLTLVQLSETRTQVIWTFHHVLLDGWSLFLVLQDVFACYEADVLGVSLVYDERPSYRDYISWLSVQDSEAAEAYWRQTLRGIVAPTPLGVDVVPQREQQSGQVYTEEVLLVDAVTTTRWQEYARQQHVTLNTLMQAAWALVLSHYSGQADVVFGTAVAGRSPELVGVEHMIGLFINTVPVRVQVHAEEEVGVWLTRLQEQQLEQRPYEHSSLVQVQGWSEIPDKGLFESLFVFENYPTGLQKRVGTGLAPVRFPISTLELEAIQVVEQTNYPLTIIVVPAAPPLVSGGGLSLRVIYDTQRFEHATIERLLLHIQNCLQQLVIDPQQKLSALSLLTDVEREQLFVQWNATASPIPTDLCVHQLFEQQVEQTPDAIALVFADEELTYAELNRRANQLASHLQRLGVGPEVLVGVSLARSIEMVVGLLAVLKAGGAYVPLDPGYPQERLARMLADAQVAIVLTHHQFDDGHVLVSEGIARINLSTDWQMMAREKQENLQIPVESAHLVYLLYTSGSTGQPKGVQIPHRAVVNFLTSMREQLTFTREETLLSVTSITFDIAGLELFLPLMVGSRVVMVSQEVARDGERLGLAIRQHGTTIMQATPSTWRLLLNADGLAGSSLRILCGGESMPPDLAHQLLDVGVSVWNLYGPTETTIWSTAYPVTAVNGPLPIGRPLANTQIYLLDRNLQPVPIGVVGELCIGGEGLARGYISRPEQTAERFIPNTWGREPGERLYRTGDLARYRPDGTLECLGRIDNQVKIRGYRIELFEIEAVLRSNATVQESVVVVREERPDDKQLVAYVVPAIDELDTLSLEEKQIEQWQALYDETYRIGKVQENPTFNISGWNSSYTGLPIPATEMREQIEQAVSRILALHPQRVLEIGFGTGMLLFRIAPHTTSYLASDFSPAALSSVQEILATHPLPQVRLVQESAHQAILIPPESVDAVIINSVVQYFPSITYLLRVLEGAFAALQPGGFLFIGDVRSLPLFRAYATSVEVARASDTLTREQIRQRIERRMLQEEELLIDPTFFQALQRELPQVGEVSIQLKRGSTHNELTRYRYDVIVRKAVVAPRRDRGFPHQSDPLLDEKPLSAPANHPLAGSPEALPLSVQWEWGREALTYTRIQEYLLTQMPQVLHIRRVPNRRLAPDLQALAWVEGSQGPETVGAWRAEQAEHTGISPDEGGLDPEELWEQGERLGYQVSISWSTQGESGEYDVLISREMQKTSRLQSLPTSLPAREKRPSTRWLSYANNPLQGKMTQTWLPHLRHYLEGCLPEYMIPAQFVVLDSLPRTSHGKVDRRALPASNGIQVSREGTFVAPQTPLQEQLAAIWEELLHLSPIGIYDNFFELGGHSLLATQLIAYLRSMFQVEIPLRHLFEKPTLAELALVIEQTQRAILDQTKDERLAQMLIEMGGLSEDDMQVIFTDDQKIGKR